MAALIAARQLARAFAPSPMPDPRPTTAANIARRRGGDDPGRQRRSKLRQPTWPRVAHEPATPRDAGARVGCAGEGEKWWQCLLAGVVAMLARLCKVTRRHMSTLSGSYACSQVAMSLMQHPLLPYNPHRSSQTCRAACGGCRRGPTAPLLARWRPTSFLEWAPLSASPTLSAGCRRHPFARARPALLRAQQQLAQASARRAVRWRPPGREAGPRCDHQGDAFPV
jgi:uncharacterized CHY-type Zn-finger protein